MKPLKLYLPAFLILMIISGSISGQTEDFMDRPISKKTTSANIDKSKIKTKQFDSHDMAPGKEQTTEKRLKTQTAITMPKPGNGISGPTDDLCVPVYVNGCSYSSAIYSFAVEEIQNFGSFCANNTGYPGWSEYYDLGPAILFPGMTHTFTIGISANMGTSDYWVDIWIDLNNDLILTDDELILDDFGIETSVLHYIDIAIPLDAAYGLHVMRARTRWHNHVNDPCMSYSQGEAEDYYISIGTSDFGTLEGYVTEFTGGAPVENALISVNNGMHTTMTGPDGSYVIGSVFLGDWIVTCTHDSYNPVSETVTIIVDDTTQQNFSLTAPTMEIDSLDIFVNIDISSTTTEYVTISNNGDGSLHWSANIINNTGKAFLGPESTAFAYNSDPAGQFPEGPIYFSLNDPSNVTAFGSPVSGTIVTAEWINETWYGIAGSGFLVTMDTTTGEFTTIGTSPDLSGMAFDWTQTVMYGVDLDGNLYTIDLETGAGSIVATTMENIITIVCDNDGHLYGFNEQWNTFGEINKNTGYFSYIGSIGFDITGAQDASVDHETNTIYWSLYNSTNGGELYTVDAATGSPSLIGGFPDDISVTALAIPGSPSGWISINTVFGNIAPGDDYQFAINLDAMNYIPGDTLEADIHFTSVPDVGDQNVHVTMTIGTEEWGNIEGTITLGGSVPYNNGNVTEVEVTAGPYSALPDSSGNYSIEVYPGTYDITATLYGYTQQIIPDITVIEGGTVSNLDFIMPTINGRLMGIVTDELTGEPIENATVSVLETDFEVITAADGTYEIFIEAGTYSVMVEHPGYMPQSINDVVVIGEADTQLDFELQYQESCIFTVELWDDYGDGWNGCTLTILVDGNVVLDNITLASGYGPETFDFETGTGSEVVCAFTPGGWPHECSYYVYDNDGTEVFADGLGGVEPTGGTFISLCGYVYGDLAGYLTDCITGDPIGNGEIILEWYCTSTATTAPDGYFFIEDILVGTWPLYYSAPGYCLPQEVVMVTIFENQTTTIDNLCLYPAQFEVDPDTLYVSMEPNSNTTETITLNNPGGCAVDWTASIDFNSKELFDLQFQYLCAVGGGEAGIETDGNFLYTTKWNGPGIYKYGLDGTYIGTLNVGSSIRDLAYDGNYFYGAAASPTVFQMDFDNPAIISTFTAPTDVRAIAYNHDEDVFYANNWGSQITKFDMTGVNLGSFPVGPVGDSYYGFAYDDVLPGCPFLWGYAQVGNSQNELVQIELPSGIETGIYEDIGEYITVSPSALAGGLFTHPNLLSGTWTIGGLVQNEWLWGIGDASCLWLVIEPVYGTLAPGEIEDITAHIESIGLLPGIHEADIIFTTNPVTDPEIVHVILTVQGLAPPINLTYSISCTDICLGWEMPAGSFPDYFNIYRDGMLVDTTAGPGFCDTLLMPEVEYCYYITAVYNGEESQPTPDVCITIPLPENLEPTDPGCTHYENGYFIYWDQPDGCLASEGYNLYRNGVLLETLPNTDLSYFDPNINPGFFEYSISSVYYFGESEPVIAFCITGIEKNIKDRIAIYPNPVKSWLVIRSDAQLKFVEIYNNIGIEVQDQELSGTESLINISNCNPGIYFLKITTSDSDVFIRKIVVE